ncbi:MAG: hypothetical protein AAB879_00585 [Patescibacteria group bacterium]
MKHSSFLVSLPTRRSRHDTIGIPIGVSGSASRLYVGIAALLILMGAGCDVSRISSILTNSQPSGQPSASLQNVTSAERAKKILFVRGSVIVMKQGFKGIAGPLVEKLGFGGGEGTRDISIRKFAEAVNADIEWKLTAKVPANPKDLKDSGTRQTSGAILGANLLSSHTLYLPGYWVEGERTAKDASVIWLSQDVFEDLAASKSGTLDFGILDIRQTGALNVAKELAHTLDRLKASVNREKKDVNYIETDSQPSDWTLKVNGKDVTVQVLKARNWFGEIVVLNSKKNPLVLKVTLNPLALAAIDTAVGSAFLTNGLGYEIVELKDVKE